MGRGLVVDVAITSGVNDRLPPRMSKTTGIGVEDRTEVRVASMAWSEREVVA